MELVLKGIVGLALVYGVLAILVWRFQEKLAFPGPRVRLIEPGRVGISDGQRVTVTTSDSVTLHGWFLPVTPAADGRKAPGLLWFYGNMETVSGLAPLVRELRPPGTALLILDYRGYGESSGTPTEEGLYRDADAAWAFLAAQPDVDPERIAVYGRSLGAAVALYLADTRPVRAVILDSPFSSGAAMARRHYAWLPQSLVRISMDNLQRAGRLRVPLLVFHGTEDAIAPLPMGRAVAEAGHARELVLIEGAGHNDTYDLGGRQYREKMHAFLRDVLLPQ